MPSKAVVALSLAASLDACARDAEPTTFAVPRTAAAQIRMRCPANTFIGTMTVNCPQPLSRTAPAQ